MSSWSAHVRVTGLAATVFPVSGSSARQPQRQLAAFPGHAVEHLDHGVELLAAWHPEG
jgi:hypothetical protein